jgi:hypothetical protein
MQISTSVGVVQVIACPSSYATHGAYAGFGLGASSGNVRSRRLAQKGDVIGADGKRKKPDPWRTGLAEHYQGLTVANPPSRQI